MLPQSTTLDPRLHSAHIQDLARQLKTRVAGQDGPIDKLAAILETYFAGYGDPNAPVGVVLFLGPSGVGKTSLVENLCDILYGNPKAHVRLNCADFKDGHQTRSLRPAGHNTLARGRGKGAPGPPSAAISGVSLTGKPGGAFRTPKSTHDFVTA